MVISKKWSVLGIALIATLLFALPAFAAWQSTPVSSVSFKETIPQNAIVVDEKTMSTLRLTTGIGSWFIGGT